MKIRKNDLTKEQIIETLDTLYTAAGSLNGRETMKQFLRDLLTESERIMLGRRLMIARRILAGEGYDDIRTNLGVGRATIATVHHWLQDQMPGYEKAIKGLLEFKIPELIKKAKNPYAFTNLSAIEIWSDYS